LPTEAGHFLKDTVLDLFLGSGSTLIACVQTNRKGIGIEVDKNYCEIAKQRLIGEGQIYQTKLGFKEDEKNIKSSS